MYLLSHSRKKKNKTYTYYTLAETYRENGKNKKKIISYLGRLTPEHVQKIRNVLASTQADTVVLNFKDLAFKNHWRYLDIAFLNSIWDSWNISKVFSESCKDKPEKKIRAKDISTADIAKILTFYRCLEPGSYLSSVDWVKGTTCNHILGIDNSHFNDSRIYRELTAIEKQKKQIEEHIYKRLTKQDISGMRIVYYDLSDSYFEGRKCPMAKPGKTKNHGFKSKRIVLSLLVNSEGYPFSWKVMDGDTIEVETLKANADRWHKQFKFPRIIMVFDRGMVSDENLKHLEDKKNKYLYITALDKDQIQGVTELKKRFDVFLEKEIVNQKEITELGFVQYDENTYYDDIGVNEADGRRYILIFNPGMFKDERERREELMQEAQDYMKMEKETLMNAKKSRQIKPTEKRIDNTLHKLKMNKYIGYQLENVKINSQANASPIETFNLTYWKKDDTIENSKLRDGLWMLVTNIKEDTSSDEYQLKADKLIAAYRNKNRVEEGFKEVKSFLKFQPTFVSTRDHVSAHYTICILSYLLNVTITNKLRSNPINGVDSVRKLYDILKPCEIGEISVKNTEHIGRKLMPLTKQQENILKLFSCSEVVGKKHMASIGVESM